MKPFTRIKNIKGHEYLYEITPYYDSGTKKVKQKSKYLGKNVDGKPIKVRSQIKPLISTPKKVLSYGEFLPLFKIIEDLKLDRILSKVLPEQHVWATLSVAMNYIIKPLASVHIKSWYEGTVLSVNHPDIPISSQSLSNLFELIGNDATHIDFTHHLIQRTSTSSTLVYNITSISSYSQIINLLENGYNRDEFTLPRINLSIIIDRELGIPIMYDLYTRSIVDVSTLKNTLTKIQAQGIQNYT
ncbi:MAG: IS1634 family transposase, partial [Methanosarcinales archaeon]